jgi:ferritin-like metal-binding protein YciE
MAKLKNLQEFLIDELKDLYSAEQQILKALPKMVKAASSDELKQGFEEHLKQTEGHVNRLERISQILGKTLGGKKCAAMEGLLSEGKEIIDEDAEPEVKDAALITAAQKVEHYEISAYGSARTHARLLGHSEAEDLLQETLDEEAQTDEKLTEIAQDINIEAI